MLLLIAVACVVYVPSLRHRALEKGIAIACEKTGLDIEVDSLYLSPFHHSPMVLYHAYKGEEDLPIEVAIDSLFVGHRGQDTLLCVQCLRLNATIKVKGERLKVKGDSILSIPIEVEKLRLEEATFHSDSLIAAVGIDGLVGHLEVSSPNLNIAQGRYPLHGLRLSDTYVGIDLRDTPPDTTVQDTTPLRMAFDIPDGELRNIHFVLTPIGLDLHTRSMSTNALVDVGSNTYDARRIEIGKTRLAIGSFALPIDTLYGDACVALAHNLITSNGLHVRSDEMGAQADLETTQMNLETMEVEVVGDADFKGSKARMQAKYDIDDEAYDAHVEVERVDLSPFMQANKRVVLAGTIDAKGKGIDPKSRAMRSALRMHLTDAMLSMCPDFNSMRNWKAKP